MSDPNLNLGIGGGQPPIGGPGPSLDEEERAMKKGRGLVLGVAIAGALLVAVALAALLAVGGEEEDHYGTIGRQINGMKRDNFDPFWRCALPEQRLELLDNDRDLRAAINLRANGRPAAYAQHVRTECMVKLNEHEPPGSLLPPDDLREQLDQLGAALEDLKGGWQGYLAALEASEGYDEEAMAPHVGKIAKGWFDYRTAHVRLNDSIRARQGQ